VVKGGGGGGGGICSDSVGPEWRLSEFVAVVITFQMGGKYDRVTKHRRRESR